MFISSKSNFNFQLFTCVLSSSNKRIYDDDGNWKQFNVHADRMWLSLPQFHFVHVVVQDNDGLIERWKRKDIENIVELHNKAPVWNEGRSIFLLLFVEQLFACELQQSNTNTTLIRVKSIHKKMWRMLNAATC